MPMPTLLVEFQAPGSSTWNNITSYVQSVNIDRGGDRDISEVSAGSCNVVLFNRNRQFDPKYSSGFYTAIRPVGKVRISSQGFIRFFGYITAWNFTYDIEGNSFAILSASDGLSELGKKSLVEFTPTAQLTGIRIDNVLSRAEVNWPTSQRALEAGATLYSYQVDGGTNALSYIQQCVSSEGGIFFADRQGNLTYLDTGSTGGTSTTTRTNLITNPSAETAATGYITGTRSTAQAKYRTYSILAGKPGLNYQVVYVQPGQGNSATYTASAWVYVADTTYRNYTITATCYTSGGASFINATSKTFELAGTGWQQIGVTFTGGGATWTGADSFEILVEAEASTALAFYVDAVMLEQAEAVFDYFDGTTKPANDTYTTYTSVWNGTADASTSTMTIVRTFPNITPTSFTVSDVSGIDYVGVEMAYGAETLYNRVVVDWPWRTTGSPIIVNNSTSQSTYGIKTLELTDNLLADSVARTNRADTALAAFKDPEFRINSVTVALHDQTSGNNNTLAVIDIGSTCNITFTPNKVGSAISPTAYTVIGISESITPDTYETTYYLSASGSLGRVGGAVIE